MSSGNEDEVSMAECGVCRAVVPVSSENCPGCGVAFSGVSEEALGECGACKALIPLNSESCTQCGVTFVADNVIEVLSDWLTATGLSTRDLFVRFDANDDGKITSEEFKNGLLSLKLADLPPSQIDRLVTAIDEDGNGIIDLDELSNTFGEPDNKPLKEIAPEDDETSDSDEEVAAEEESDEEESDDDSEEEESDDADEEESDDDADEEESDDDADEEESDDDADEEESDDDADEEESDDDSEEEESDDVTAEDDEFMRFGKAIANAGYTIREVFERLDTNEDGRIDGPELQSGLSDILGENLVARDVSAILKTIDKDDDGHIDAMEIIEALEKLDLNIESDKSDSVEKAEFPSPLQKLIMGKTANDVIYPICYFLAFAFITVWIVNGLGLIVDGTGGNVVYEGHTDDFGVAWDQGDYNICAAMPDLADCKGYVIIGETYPCDPAIDDGGCANSLTPLMEHSSMAAGFYGDGIFMIVLGLLGFAGILFLHLVYAKSLRTKARALSGESEDSSEEEVTESEDSDDENSESDTDDDSEGDTKAEDSEKDAKAGNSDADIDIGSDIGLVLEDEEFYGVIIEFDDDEGLVTIETEDGEEITGYQDDMFIE